MKRFFSPHLFLLSSILALSVAWELGYSPLSLESGAGVLIGVVLGALLSALSMWSPTLRVIFIVFIFLSMVDIYFLPEAWQAAVGLAIGLLLALKFRSKLPVNVLVIMALVFLVGLLYQDVRHRGAAPVVLSDANEPGDELIVHLVMDELGSLDSVPLTSGQQREANAIMAAYAERGFRLYENVLSLTPDTQKSMSVLMDISFKEDLDGNVQRVPGKNAYRILNNRLQTHVRSEGWTVAVVQPEYLDYCEPTFQCFTYGLANSMGVFEDVQDWQLRLRIFFRESAVMLASASRGWIVFENLGNSLIKSSLLKKGWSNPTTPLVSLRQVDLLQRALTGAAGTGRRYVFAHILSPHFPWIFDAHCKVKDIEKWALPYASRAELRVGAQQEAIDAYWDQSMCAHRTVLRFIDALDAVHLERVSFVIHGDHGPRTMARSFPSDGADMDEQVRKNLLAPFVASRLKSDRGREKPQQANLQVLIYELIEAEAKARAADTQSRH